MRDERALVYHGARNRSVIALVKKYITSWSAVDIRCWLVAKLKLMSFFYLRSFVFTFFLYRSHLLVDCGRFRRVNPSGRLLVNPVSCRLQNRVIYLPVFSLIVSCTFSSLLYIIFQTFHHTPVP